MKEINESETVARLILSTKRKKRDFSILEIAEDISNLKTKMGSLGDVAKVIGISTGMLNQFLSVFKLPVQIQEQVQQRKIDSVAIVFLLSKFSNEDALLLMPLVVENKISSQELKVLLPYRKQHAGENVLDIVAKLDATRNIKISVIKLPKNIVRISTFQVSEIIKTIVGEENLQEVSADESFVYIKIKKEGEKIMRSIAREKSLTLSALITTLIK